MTLTNNRVFSRRVLVFFLLFLVLVLGLNNGNASAVSDYTVTIDWDNLTETYLCGGNSGRNCSDYAFFVSHPISTCSGAGASYYVFGLSGSENSLISICSDIIAPISSPSYIYITGGRNLGSRYSGNFTVTLTSEYGASPTGNIDITNNGTFDVSSYATATVNVPVAEVIEDPISNDFQKVFFKIVEKIIPAFGILLVVWFGIDMFSSLIFGRGR